MVSTCQLKFVTWLDSWVREGEPQWAEIDFRGKKSNEGLLIFSFFKFKSFLDFLFFNFVLIIFFQVNLLNKGEKEIYSIGSNSTDQRTLKM